MSILHALAGSPTDEAVEEHPGGYRYSLEAPDLREVTAHIQSSFKMATTVLATAQGMFQHLYQDQSRDLVLRTSGGAEALGGTRASLSCTQSAVFGWADHLNELGVDVEPSADSESSPEELSVLLKTEEAPFGQLIERAAFHLFMVELGEAMLRGAEADSETSLSSLGRAVGYVMEDALDSSKN